MKQNPKLSLRGKITLALTLIFFAAFFIALTNIQIINSEKYRIEGASVSVRSVAVNCARGDILDRNGEPLVTNRQGNAIVFDAAVFPPTSEQEKRNEIIITLIRLFENNKVEWHDDIPLRLKKNGKSVEYTDASESELDKMRVDILGLNTYATAENCMDALIKKFKLENYSLSDARKIASVCYEFKKIEFSVSSPYTFADDVPMEIVAKVKENSAFFTGVDVSIVSYREYSDSTLLPHILGRVGVISAEEYAEAKENGKKYAMNAIVGKDGVEKLMEDYLKGTPGVKTVRTDSEGNAETKSTVDPVQGDTVVLTIDSSLQKVAKDALSQGLEVLRESSIVDPAGAIVIEDVNSGDILASYSYPGYDLDTFSEDYDELRNDKRSPLWNRSFLSTYSPGSTMKPCTATAALEKKLIDKDTYFYCSRKYNYLGTEFQCLQPHMSPYLNVVSAINESCNIFFFNVAQLTDIATINSYATVYGLGAETGVELPEARGILDSPEYRASLGQDWLPGFTLQNAIGNGGSMFSPIQLVNYCSTIANGGTRYKPHILKTVKSPDFSQTRLNKTSEVSLNTGISKSTLDLVREGMALVGSVGYCSEAFRDLPVSAAAKTGTSQVDREIEGVTVTTNNGFLITYAPAEDPQIAICIAAEGAGSGSSLAPIAASVYDYYFGEMGSYHSPQNENELI